MRSILLNADSDILPDTLATLHDDGSVELSIVGLAGLDPSPRALTREELAVGIISSNPPTIRTLDKPQAPLFMLRAIEISLPDGLLDNDIGAGALDKEQLLLSQVTRIVRNAMIALEPPE